MHVTVNTYEFCDTLIQGEQRQKHFLLSCPADDKYT